MTPVADSVATAAKPRRYFARAAESGDDVRSIHRPIMSEYLIPCNSKQMRCHRSSDTHSEPGRPMFPGMETPLQQEVARRLRAVMGELKLNRRQMADYLGVAENRLGNWLGKGPKSSMPAEEALILLCRKVPGLTLDYMYRGLLDHVPTGLAIRLMAREQGMDPDERAPDPDAVLRAGSEALRKV
jgi:transcriptional regulator with XRE-family HTH domain